MDVLHGVSFPRVLPFIWRRYHNYGGALLGKKVLYFGVYLVLYQYCDQSKKEPKLHPNKLVGCTFTT